MSEQELYDYIYSVITKQDSEKRGFWNNRKGSR